MAAHQAFLSLGFSRQEHWSGLPFTSPTHACMLGHFSHVQLCVNPWAAAHQAPLSTGFSRQEYRSGLPFPSPSKQQDYIIREFPVGLEVGIQCFHSHSLGSIPDWRTAIPQTCMLSHFSHIWLLVTVWKKCPLDFLIPLPNVCKITVDGCGEQDEKKVEM